MESGSFVRDSHGSSVLIYSDSKYAADMGHAAGVVVSDPFLYADTTAPLCGDHRL